MTKEEFYKVLELLVAYYGSKAKPLKTLNVQAAWWMALERFPYEVVRDAVVDYAVKSRFFPTVADITSGIDIPGGQVLGAEKPPAPKTPRREVTQLEKDAIKRMMAHYERSDSPSEQ